MQQDRYIWLNGQLVQAQKATVNILSPTAQFGANVFEGIRCYWNSKRQNLYAFRLADHYARLADSARIFGLEHHYTQADLEQAFFEVIHKNNYKEDIAVRQTLFVDGFTGSWFSTSPVGMFVAPIPKPRLTSPLTRQISCCVSSWERISDANLSPRVKVGANYINSRTAQLEAVRNGYDQAILLNHRKTVSEGPGSCLFIVRDGYLITPPTCASILESITRQTIIEIAQIILNVPVIEREIDRTELYTCDEAFLCGSAVEVLPITSIDRFSVGSGAVGTLTNKLHQFYLSAVDNSLPNFEHWCTPICL